MFSCNHNGSIFTDPVFWVVAVTAVIIIWVHYTSNDYLHPFNGEGTAEYCC